MSRLTAVGIGALGNMHRWFAKHLPGDSEVEYLRIFDSDKGDPEREEAKRTWREHETSFVTKNDYKALIGDGVDLVTICAGKHGEALKIYPALLDAISKSKGFSSNPPLIVDFSTYSPKGAEVISAYATGRGALWAGAPLSGGPGGAKAGDMIIMFGGPRSAYDLLESKLLSHVGNPTLYGEAPGDGAKIKMIGQCMVFGQLEAICGALAMETEAFRKAEIGGREQSERFDTLNRGAGGGNQWPKALCLGIRDGVWNDLGFLNPHAAADAIYSALFAAELGLSRKKIVDPLLSVAASLGFAMKRFGTSSATQSLVLTLLSKDTEEHDAYLEKIGFSNSKNVETAAELVTNSLPEEVAEIVMPNISLKDFGGPPHDR